VRFRRGAHFDSREEAWIAGALALTASGLNAEADMSALIFGTGFMPVDHRFRKWHLPLRFDFS